MTAFPNYSTGTVAVAAGALAIIGTSTIWSGVNARAGDDIVINGNTVVIQDVTDPTHLVIDAWPYATVAAGATYKIIQRSPFRYAGGQAMADVSTMVAALNTDGFYVFVPSTSTVPDPSYGNNGQYAFQASTGKLWSKSGGVWNFLGVYTGFSFLGAWSGATAYGINQVVTLAGSSYICILAHTNFTPPNAIYWSLLASIGNTGPIGPTGASYAATSATSFLIGTGSKAFTTQSGLAYVVGSRVRAASNANPNNYMEGIVTAYSGATLTANITVVGGSGTFADWNLSVAGDPGSVSSTASLAITGTTASTSPTTGALTVAGGVGVGGAVNVGGLGAFSGGINITGTAGLSVGGIWTQANYGTIFSAARASPSAYQYAFFDYTIGIIFGGFDGAGNWKVNNTTTSTSTTTGALTVAGGVGIAGSVNIGGPLTVNGTPIAPFTLPSATTSGSGSNTTGTIAAASPTLTLAAAIDFANGHGIRVNHAGAAFTLNPPTAATVTPTGTAGTTAYAYTIASLNTAGGVGQAIANVTTATGNAALSATNYNAISWTGATGTAPAAYAVYGRVAGSLMLLGIVPFGTNTFSDIGAAAITAPDWLPTTPQGASLANWLITTISSGAGTTTLTLAVNATTAATGQFVIHDDTANLQAWIASAQTAGNVAFLPPGSYQKTAMLTASGRLRIMGAGYQGDSAGGYKGTGVTQSSGFTASVIVCGILDSGIVATTDLAVEIEHLQITYPLQPVVGTTGITIQALAGAGHANTQSSIHHVMVTGADTAVSLVNALEFNVESNHLLYNWSYGVSANAPNFPSYQQATINGNEIWGNGVPSHQAHILMQAGGDIRIVNNKLQAGGVNTNAIALFGASSGSQNLEPMTIVGNSIEGAANGILFNTANASFTTSQIVIAGNQIWAGVNAIRVNTFGTAKWLAGLTITGNALMVNGGANKTAMVLDNATIGIITGNTLSLSGGGSTSTGIVLGTNTTNINVQSNVYDGGFTTKVSNSGTGNTLGGGSM